MAEGFFERLNESELGQLAEFGSKLGGTYTFVAGIVSLFEESDTDKILGAIEQLREEMQRNFQQLGDLIIQQTQIIVDVDNRNAMASALASSETAYFQLQRYLETNAMDALEAAENESLRGVGFFTNLGGSPDPYFVPGLLKAGTIRLLVIAAEPLSFRSDAETITAQINKISATLRAMIDSIQQRVEAAHTVDRVSHERLCPDCNTPHPPAGCVRP